MSKRIGTFAILALFSFGIFANFAQAQSPQVVWQIPYTVDKRYNSIKFTADNSQLIGGGEFSPGGTEGVLIKRFNAATGAELAVTQTSFLYYGVSEIALSPDEQRIITANYDTPCNLANPPVCEGGFLQYGTALLNRLAVPPGSRDPNYTVDYAPNGQLIVLGGIWYNYGPTDYHNLRLVRASDLTVVRTMQGHLRAGNDGGTLSARFSPDGTLLGTSGRDKFVKIWRVSDGALLRAINFDDAYQVDSAEFSPDGQFIAAGRTGVEAQVKVWRVSTGELVKTFNVSSQYTFTNFNKVGWTPDGSHVVAGISFGVGYGPNKIRFWNFQTGQLAQDYSTQQDRIINDIEFSPDGQRFAWAASSQIFVAVNPFPGALFPGLRTFSDFDGDGKTDVSVFRNGAWFMQESRDGFRHAQFGAASDKLVPADYDGDGKTDVAVFRSGAWYVLRSSNNQFQHVQFGAADDAPQAGDFDGDGKSDIAVFRPTDGVWYLNQSRDGFRAVRFGQAGDKPLAADYDGDSKSDVAVFRGGMWYLNQSRDGFRAVHFGLASDTPVPADYDGDGKTDISVFRDGTWYFNQSRDGFLHVSFGYGSDKPVPGDYDGDGRTDAAVFRDGVWHMLGSTGGAQSRQFGLPTDTPVPSAFIPKD